MLWQAQDGRALPHCDANADLLSVVSGFPEVMETGMRDAGLIRYIKY